MIKVKVFKVKDEKRDELVYEYNSKISLDKPFEIRDEILELQNKDDFLKLGKKLNSLGITSISCHGRAVDSFGFDGDEKMVQTGKNSCLIGYSARKGIPNDGNDCVYLDEDGVAVPDESIVLSFTAYESGLMLSTGKTISGIFTGNEPAYLSKITKKNIISRGLKNAKLFTTYKSLIEYLEKNEHSLKYAVKELGFDLELVSVFDGAKDSNKNEIVQQALNLIEEFNAVGHNPTQRELPKTLNDEEIQKECIARLKDLDVMNDVVNNFKKGKVMMSEFNGILYNLDKNAQRAIEIVEGYDCKPYHVVVSPICGQNVYAVLYTSNNTDEWEYERLNPKGQLDSWVYMPDYDQVEHGPIWVTACSGGVARIG